MTDSVPGELTVSRATPDDWRVVSGWAADEGWNPGLRDGASFFAQDPEGFFMGRIEGEPVSAISVVNYDEVYAFLGFYLVRPDLRGHGHGLATWRTALAHAGNRTVGLDGVVAQQDNYRRSGFEFAHRTIRYSGTVPGGAARPARILPVEAAGLRAITAYDAASYPADRPRFLESWLTAPGHRALARIVDGRITGYGVLRPAHGALRIGPLFADTRADAEELFDALTAETDGVPVVIDVPESQPHAVALAETRGMKPTFETARMYTGPVRERAEERVFGVTTLELG
ncbi:GNAT family N-acetyltransferase [Streptomyces durmitorensis]|uniref:GNAT family N-acetyltransferase n=1 Tax=Streptomyces durmitorensis TaxID=319947 RepID=A0ABY4PM66_9ACTN|nr:GNAT family N-acetyltransferase [Streptomyces durmitorensis]UQT54716.1 GNAT family N-acetyltransferase [Streptomyces durmitorensis]